MFARFIAAQCHAATLSNLMRKGREMYVYAAALSFSARVLSCLLSTDKIQNAILVALLLLDVGGIGDGTDL